MEFSQNDFLAQYKAISAKLKKRFLRKPNISEASAQFSFLAKNLENQECPHYAAFCCLAVARCEHSVGNTIFESQHLVHAARLFLETEQQSHTLLCPSYSEYLQAAISAYGEAIKVYLDSQQFSLASSLYLELAQALKNLGRINEAIPYFYKAAELHRFCALDYLNDLNEISECRMKVGDFDGALSTLTEMQVIAEKKGFKENNERIGAYTQILTDVEVTRILLLLLLQPPSFKLNPEHAKLLERYADIDREPVDYIDEDLYLMLQSLMIAVHEKEEAALLALEKDLWPCLTGLQCDILSRILARFKEMPLKVPCH